MTTLQQDVVLPTHRIEYPSSSQDDQKKILLSKRGTRDVLPAHPYFAPVSSVRTLFGG
ncbi:hypothetical protein ACFV3R_23225 [Streptomyces sp. NPDC059740]|uniref:hypothetical protein n=1 Tax=Streptomyces sp. NPDC059740 TaxID=3346926 RepID=UPI003669E4CD